MAKKDSEKKTESEVSPLPKPRKRATTAKSASSKASPKTTTRHRKATKRPVEPQLPTDAEIAELAYLIYEARCAGSSECDWAMAEAYLKSRM